MSSHSREPQNDKLKWYVTWCPGCNGWAVMKRGVRDSWAKSKRVSNIRRDELNKFWTPNQTEGFLVDGFV